MTNDPFQVDLTLASIEDLCEELRKRCDGCLIVCDSKDSITGDSEGQTLIAFRGSPAHVMGLAEYAKSRMIHKDLWCNDEDGDT